MQVRQLMQSLLDTRRALSEAGWQIEDTSGDCTGTAVKAINLSASSNAGGSSSSSTGSGTTEGLPNDVMLLLLLQRELLLATAQWQVMQSGYDKEGAALRKTQWQLKQVMIEAKGKHQPKQS
jgi:hypothetical protein